jgi:predicted MPP superfamily phosphohydrolase
MIVFLTVYLLIYGSVHWYFYARLRTAVELPDGIQLGAAIFLSAMVAGPIVMHLLEGSGPLFLVRFLSNVCYTWMGFIFLFFAASLFLDLLRVLPYLFALGDIFDFPLYSFLRFIISMVLALIITIYGTFEANNIQVERLTIQSEKLPTRTGNIKIAQISDLHLGTTVPKSRIRKISRILKQENPDLIVSTGDLIDASDCNGVNAAAFLAKFNPTYGKFAVTGNHEFYHGLDEALECTEGAGFKMIRNDLVHIDRFLTIIGVDDDEALRFGVVENLDEAGLISRVDQNRFILYLRHQPRWKPYMLGKFDLMLSGHTHKGQIFPFNLLTGLFFKVNAGREYLGNGSQIYVSRGTGCWGPQIRFLAPPEVTIIELMP